MALAGVSALGLGPDKREIIGPVLGPQQLEQGQDVLALRRGPDRDVEPLEQELEEGDGVGPQPDVERPGLLVEGPGRRVLRLVLGVRAKEQQAVEVEDYELGLALRLGGDELPEPGDLALQQPDAGRAAVAHGERRKAEGVSAGVSQSAQSAAGAAQVV